MAAETLRSVHGEAGGEEARGIAPQVAATLSAVTQIAS